MKLQDKINQGYKRLAIISTLMSIILAIPALYLSLTYLDFSFSIIITYQVLLCVGILMSPKIVNKIWK
jgi:uncharacterized protein YebE (UPF0316 family)